MPLLSQDPKQVETQKDRIFYTKNEKKYFADPKFSYEIWGLVVSKNMIGAWFDIANSREKDLCVVWGDNLKTDLNQISFWSGNYTCNWMNSHQVNINGQELSNNHLVAANSLIRSRISSADIGDQIYIKGYLSEYGEAETGKVLRGTSVNRTDTGNRACETIFVEEFEILKKNYSFWKFWYLFSFYGFVVVCGLSLYWLFNKRRVTKKKP